MIPGALLSWLWEHPKDGFMEEPFQLYSKAFPEYPWDVLSLQPFDRHIDGTDGDLATERNQSRCKGDGAGLAQLADNEMGIQARAARSGHTRWGTSGRWLGRRRSGNAMSTVSGCSPRHSSALTFAGRIGWKRLFNS